MISPSINFVRVYGRTLVRKCTTQSYQNVASTAGIATFSAICLGAVGLGTWQLQRYSWKVELIGQIEKNIKEDPSIIPDVFSQHQLSEQSNQLKGRRILLTGKFDHSAEVLVGPRSAPPGLVGAAAQGLAMNPQGYFLITPFHRPDGTVILVNRGWVPITSKDSWSQPGGQLSLQVFVSEGEKRGQFTPDNMPTTGKLLWVEPAALVQACKLGPLAEPVVIMEAVEDDDVPITSYPVARRAKNLAEQSVSPLTHLVYAFTWFSLAAAGFVMTYYKFRRPPLHSSMIKRKLREVARESSGSGGSKN